MSTPWEWVLAEHQRNVGFREGPSNANPWGPEQGIPNASYCDSGASMVPYHQGYRWWPESQCGEKGCAYCPSHINVGQAHGEVRFDHASRGDPADVVEGDLLFYSWNGDSIADHVETAIESVGTGARTHNIGYNTGSPEGCHDLWRDRRYLLCRLRPSRNGGYTHGGAPGPGPGPAPAPPAPSGPRVLSQGMTGQDVANLQSQLNRFGYGLAVDGDFGPATDRAVRDFQSRHGLTVDGQVGSATRGALAAAPSPQPAPTPPPAPPAGRAPDGNPYTPLVVDGGYGPQTKRALQWRLNVTEAYSHGPLVVDGNVGPATIRYMQQRLNWSNGPVGIDGQLGPQTVRALQAHVGAGVDGGWGPDTTRHLQMVLNQGSF